MNKNVKKIVVVGLVLVIGFFIYRTVAPRSDTKEIQSKNGLSQVDSTDSTTSVAKKENIDKLLSLLLSINTIKLSNNLFTRLEFTSLKDFSISEKEQELDQSYGRSNPFLPIGDEPGGQYVGPQTTGTTTGAIKTNTVTKMTATTALLVGENTYKDSLEQSFEWGTVSAPPLGNTTPLVAKTSTTTYTYSLTGLTPNTTYYYRAVVKTKDGSFVTGTTQLFKTPKL